MKAGGEAVGLKQLLVSSRPGRRKDMKRGLLVLLGLAVAFAAWNSSDAAAVQMKINTISATGSPWHKAMIRFAEIVKERTNGAIEVLVYADGQLGDISQTLTGMQMGTIDMGYFGLGSAVFLKAYAPVSIIYVPYLFKSKEEATRILNSPIFLEMYERGAKESGVRIFGAYGARSPRAIQTTKGPINKPEDLKGMKLRSPGMEIFLATFRALDMKPTSLPMTEIYMALQQGVVEGQDNGFDLAVPLKFHEVAKYWCATDHVYEVTGWFISEKVWSGLTEEQKRVFTQAAEEAGKLATELVEKLDQESIETLKKTGCTYTIPDREAFRRAWADLHKQFEGKLWPEGLVEKIRAMQR
jgi:tripartite ATP-independent transporter DctP family solute receptor